MLSVNEILKTKKYLVNIQVVGFDDSIYGIKGAHKEFSIVAIDNQIFFYTPMMDFKHVKLEEFLALLPSKPRMLFMLDINLYKKYEFKLE